MEHPQLDVTEIKESHTLDQLQEKIGQLTDRLRFAYQTQNQALINQLNMVLECYTRAQMEKLDEMFKSNDQDNQSGKIDIS
jgi:hypothetical protein